MPNIGRSLRQLVAGLTWFAVIPAASMSQEAASHVRVTIADHTAGSKIVGRVVVRAQDGGLLVEDRRGRYITLPANKLRAVTEVTEPFQLFRPEELAVDLLSELQAGFVVHATDHFVICSDASPRYTDYCARLLERVYDRYFRFMEGSTVTVREPPTSLPVIIFRRSEQFRAFAAQQHPDTDFSDCPGYYSVRDNQMLISAVSGDHNFRTNSDVIRELRKTPRQVETIVHEAVHQLAFNTGLQTRFADNPMWLSEGLAVYFEGVNGRSSLIWSRPGETSRIHLPTFKKNMTDGSTQVSLIDLFSSDQPFQASETVAEAYAKSWAFTWYLIRTDRAMFDAILSSVSSNRPLNPVSAEQRLRQISEAVKQRIPELERDLNNYMSRIR